MKLSIIKPQKGIDMGDPLVEEFRKMGHEVLTDGMSDETDALVLLSVSATKSAEDAHKKFPNVPLYVYNWDLYPDYVRKGTYPWVEFGNLMREAREIWVPSLETGARTEEIYGISNVEIVKSFAQTFDAEPIQGDYVFNGMREYPWDPQNGWLEKICTNLKISLIQPRHSLDREAYKEAVAGCRVAVCEYFEASTGGLSLIEAHALGKPVLMCDSFYQGGKDYFGDRAYYFKQGNIADFAGKLQQLLREDFSRDPAECKEWAKQFTPEVMAKNLIARIEATL